MKFKNLKFFLLVIGILFLTGCSKNYIKEIDYNQYKELISSNKTFILEVMRDDCINCKNFKPKLNEVAKEYNIEIMSISTDNLSDEELDVFGVSGTPTVIFYKNGKEETTAARIIGDTSKDKIVAKFKASGFIK